MHSVWFRSTFLRVLKFLQIKKGGPNFWGEPILQKIWIIWSPHLYLNFKSFLDTNSSSFIRFQCILHDSGVLFSESSNFYKLKREDLISGGNQFCLNYLVPLLYFNFKSFKYWISSSFIRFQCILHDSAVLFSESWNFYKLKRREPLSGGNHFCRMSELFGPALLYLNFQSFLDPNSSSFIRFQCVLYDSQEFLSDVWNFYKLKTGNLISVRNQFCRMFQLFGPPFCISILKVF